MKNKKYFVVFIVLGYVLASQIFHFGLLSAQASEIDLTKDIVIVIPIRGELESDESEQSPQLNPYVTNTLATYSEDVASIIDSFSQREDVKGFILDIDSVGGSGKAVRTVEKAILRSSKPVVSVIRGTGLSSGYEMVITSDHVFASELSDIGDIGIIIYEFAETPSGELLTCIYPSSKYKNIYVGSDCYRFDQWVLDDMEDIVQHQTDMFVQNVAWHRNLEVGHVRQLGDGTIFSGRESVSNGLVDAIGDIQDALNWFEKRENQALRLLYI